MKRISILLAGIMLISVLGGMTAFAEDTATAKTFEDVNGTAYETAVNALVKENVIDGYEDGTFKPLGDITRAEACKVVVLSMTKDADIPEAAQAGNFSDMAGYSWSSKYVNYAVQKGIVKGYGNNIFKPGQNVSYVEMAAMLTRATGVKENTLTGSWPLNYYNEAETSGIFKDIQNKPASGNWYSDMAPRGNVAIMTYNVYDKIKEVNTPSQPPDDGTVTEPSPLDGYQGKLSGYSGRAYGMISSIGDAVLSTGDKVKRITFLFGDEELELNSSKSSLEVPPESDYLSGQVYCLKMSSGRVTGISKAGEAATPQTFVDLTNNPDLVTTYGGFGIVTSRNDRVISLEPTASLPEVPVVIVDTASLYKCTVEDGQISGYEKATIRDIQPGAYVKAYTVLDDDAGMADVVLIIHKDDVEFL